MVILVFDLVYNTAMPRRTSSILLPSVCVVLSGCPQGDGHGEASEQGSEGSGETESSGETETESSGETVGDGDGDGMEEPSCPPQGPFGTEVGDTLPELVFYRQDGNTIALHEGCGQSPPAFILFGTAAW